MGRARLLRRGRGATVDVERTHGRGHHLAWADRRLLQPSAALGLSLCLLGIVQANGPEAPWQAPLGRDHPLVGSIWEVAAARFIAPQALVEQLANGHFVLLGEKHDNPDHHRLQAWVLQKLIDAGRRPAVGFEMLTLDDAAAIARYLEARPQDAAGLGEAVNWSSRGWPAWSLYQPIADIAVRERLALIATNLSQALLRRLARHGLEAMDPAELRRLGLDRPRPPEVRARMAAEIQRDHCGYASEARVKAMVDVQQARDAQMAERLAAVGQQVGAVLIAGAGHVRRDYGVPVYLRDQAPGATAMAVAFLEVSPQWAEAAAYAGRFQRPMLPFDYVWFTARMDDDDPCEKFEEQLQKLRQ